MSTEVAVEFNATIDKIAAQLKAEGLPVKVVKANQFSKYNAIDLVVDKDTRHSLRSMDVQERVGMGRYTTKLKGFTVRWDWLGRRGMGTTRYPLRKDGTIDIGRLKADLESWKQRESHRNDAAREVADNAAKLAKDFADVKRIATELQGPAGAGVFIDVENDGKAADRIRFKVSGHISPARALAILAAVAATTDKGE